MTDGPRCDPPAEPETRLIVDRDRNLNRSHRPFSAASSRPQDSTHDPTRNLATRVDRPAPVAPERVEPPVRGILAAPGGRPGRLGQPTDLATAVWTPAIDLSETPTELVLVVNLPGVNPSTIDLSLTGNVLSLRGEKVAAEVADGHNRARERPVGSFHRQVTLTEAVDFDRVQAEAKNGVLTVRLPKQEAARPRTIPIQPASA